MMGERMYRGIYFKKVFIMQHCSLENRQWLKTTKVQNSNSVVVNNNDSMETPRQDCSIINKKKKTTYIMLEVGNPRSG